MLEYCTNLRKRFGHQNIIVSVVPELGSGFEWILSYFESEVADGAVFSDKQLVQIGWMLVMLRQNSEGDLDVWEPSFNSMPINWVRGASMTIRHLMLQREVCAQLGVEPDFPALNLTGIVSTDFLDSASFSMDREDGDAATDSGWLFKGPEPSEGRHCSLFEIAVARPEIIAFLALPIGASVAYEKNGIDVRIGDRNVSSKNNDFMGKLLR
ncbi:immunity protein Imm33 domain-containing protein [Pandoraea sputorum]